MRKIYYAILNILRERSGNLIKIVSLALGLTVSIILFTRIAFDLNCDRFYKESEKLYQIRVGYVFNNKTSKPKATIGGKFAGAIAESFPDEIESTTVIRRWDGHTLYNGSVRFAPFMLIADTLFFRTMGLEILKGNPRDLAVPDRLFLSEGFARSIFGGEDPIGKILMYDYTAPMIISGVYKDVPENNTIGHYEAVISFATLEKNQWGYIAWDGGDAFLSYARLKDKRYAENINRRVDQVISNYLPPALDFSYKAEVVPIHQIHLETEDVWRMFWIMGILAFSILMIVTLNYVLIAISSLAHRTKAIGVHKCNGASERDILIMFFVETAILTSIAVLLMLFLLYCFRDWIEDMVNVPFRSLFTIQHSWAAVCVILFLLIMGSLLPGRIFSSVPVTHILRSYSEGKRAWKRVLLFVQFIGVSFIFGILCIILVQYYQITHKDLGYSPRQIAYANHVFKNPDNVKSTLMNLPFVEGVASSGMPLVGGYGGKSGVSSSDGTINFPPRYTTYDRDYLSLTGIKLKEGRNLEGQDEILVNETFVKMIRWQDGALGQSVSRFGTVVGVVEDFASNDFYVDMDPVVIGFQNDCDKCVHVKLKAPFAENLRKLNEAMIEIFPNEDVLFLSLEQQLLLRYRSVRQFGSITLTTSVAMFFLILMGLIGYTNDEIRRRSKEIAIRKVNGAEAADILRMLSGDIAWIALPAILTGVTCSYLVGKEWLAQFARFQMPLSIPLFMSIALFVLILIFGTVILKSWRIANDDPVNSIKSE